MAYFVQHAIFSLFAFQQNMSTFMISTLIVLYEKELHVRITCCRSQEVKEALRAQMEMQRSLHEQVEVTLTDSCVLSDKNDLLINISIFLWVTDLR